MVLDSLLNSIEVEYENIEKKKSWKTLYTNLKTESEKYHSNLSMDKARDPMNKSRNRYRDVLPYDHSRVLIKCIEDNDYINASYVELDGFKDKRRYILTQGPLINTVSHFWRMVWAEQSNCIVMLNKFIEKEIIKCAQYFPLSVSEVVCHEYTDFSLCLSLNEVIDKSAYIVRIMSLENKLTNEVRQITHFHYLSWPDFGVPLTPSSFLEFLKDIRLSGGLSDPEGPSIIHCSAGIGRSGTFVLIDLALLQIAEDRKYNRDSNLQNMLLELRKCRMGLVQAAEQLRFAYSAIIMGAKNYMTGIECGEVIYDSPDSAIEPESVEEASTSDLENDSDFSDGSDIMHSNSALDNAAAAVRSRRGLPPTNRFEDTIVISKSANQTSKHNSTAAENSLQSNTVEDRRLIIEMRRNKTREKVEEIRNNMRAQDLERTRLLNRFGMKCFLGPLTGHSRNSFIVGVSVVIGVVSLVCGTAFYKYWV